MQEIHIPEKIVTRFTGQAENEYPRECCGFLLGVHEGDDTRVEEYREMENMHQDNRERRFMIPPEEVLRIEKEAVSKGLSVVGVVHSHPDHPDRPSEYDREHAWPGFSYIIVSVGSGKAESFRSWQLADDRSSFSEQPITISV